MVAERIASSKSTTSWPNARIQSRRKEWPELQGLIAYVAAMGLIGLLGGLLASREKCRFVLRQCHFQVSATVFVKTTAWSSSQA